MSETQGDEIALHYETSHKRLCALVAALTDEQLATEVAATPGWSVHDVVAHVAAIPTDAMAGRLTGIPTEEFTAGQITERRGRTVDELIAEWGPNVAPMCEGARAGLAPPSLAVDVLTHEQDIRGALGLAPVISPDELRFCTTRYSLGCSNALRKNAVPALAIEATDTDFAATAGDGDATTTLRAPEFELFRAFSGRRSRTQVLGYEWTGEPEPYLGHVNLFGPLPERDVRDA